MPSSCKELLVCIVPNPAQPSAQSGLNSVAFLKHSEAFNKLS